MKNNKKYFVSVIWGYSPYMYNMAPEENYHLHALKIAKGMGFSPVAIVKGSKKNMMEDPHFDKDITVIDYGNIFNYLHQIIKYSLKGATIYANSYEWQSFLVPFLCRRTAFAPHTQPKRSTKTRQYIQDFVYKFFKKIRVINETEKEFVLGRGIKEEKLVVAPITVSSKIFYLTNNQERKDIVYFGHITAKKNLITILKAIKEVRKIKKDTLLHIIGKNNDEDFISNIKQLGLVDCVFCYGFLPEEQLAADLNKYAVYVNSSFDEGQCVAVYDAALCGCALCLPTIMSFVGVFKDKALFHEVHDYQKLAENIIFYLDNPAIAQDHNKKNIEMILRDYSVEAVEEKTKKLFTV